MTKPLPKNKQDFLKFSFWNLLILGFLLLPFGTHLSTPIFIVSISIGIIYTLVLKRKEPLRMELAYLSFPILFVIMGISMFYSYDIKTGANLLTRSIPLLAFPLILLNLKKNESIIRKIFAGLLIGVLLTFMINVVLAFYNSISIIDSQLVFDSSVRSQLSLTQSIIDGGNYFFAGDFSFFMHPSYISLYVLACIIYVIASSYQRKTKIIVLASLTLYLFLLSSKSALLQLPIIFLVYLYHRGKDKKGIYFLALVLFCMSIVLALTNPRIRVEINRLNALDLKKQHRYTTSTASRILSWESALHLISKSPVLGYGIGDANEELLIHYLESDYFTNADNHYNAHNQYFQTMLQVGIFGLLFLLFPFVIIFLRSNDFFTKTMFLILVISLLFEAMLIRYNGIVFYSIMVPILLRSKKT